jgi:hypothetical protein
MTSNKYIDIKFSAHDAYAQSRKVGKPNNLISFGSNKPKDHQHGPRSPIPKVTYT